MTTGSQVALDSTVYTQNDLTVNTKTLDVQTNEFDEAKVNDKLRLVVYYTNSEDKPFFRDFTIEIRDYCFPDQVTINSNFVAPSISYTVNDTPYAVATFVGGWTTVPAVCNLTYLLTVSPTPGNLDLIVMDDVSPLLSVTVGT